MSDRTSRARPDFNNLSPGDLRASGNGNAMGTRIESVAAAIRKRHYDSARILLSELEEEYPLDEQIFLRKAEVARTPSEAVSALELALSLNPGNREARRSLNVARANWSHETGEHDIQACQAHFCDVCSFRHSVAFQTCKACGSCASVDDLAAMLNNGRVISGFLRQVVADLEKRRSPGAAVSAVVGRLNLGELPEAAAHLDRSLRSWPSDPKLQSWSERLDACRVIVAVDDCSAVSHAIESVLGRHGVTVRTARTGPEALQIIGKVRPEAILADARLEGFGEFRKAVRSQEDLRAVPIVPMAARIVDRAKYRTTGSAVLAKPFTAAALLKLVARVVGLDNAPWPRSWQRQTLTRRGTEVRGDAGRFHRR
jgi:CheY-like chemotaxis protein